MRIQAIKYDVFLIYGPPDRDSVRDLHARLEADGVQCFFEEEDILPGDAVVGTLDKGLLTSHTVVLVLSRDTLEHPWASHLYQASIRRYVEEGSTRIIPFVYHDCEIPPLLRPLHPVRVGEVGADQAYSQLRAALAKRFQEQGHPQGEKLHLDDCRDRLERLPPDQFEALARKWDIMPGDLPPRSLARNRAVTLIDLIQARDADGLPRLSRFLESLEEELEPASHERLGGPSKLSSREELEQVLEQLAGPTTAQEESSGLSTGAPGFFVRYALEHSCPQADHAEHSPASEALARRRAEFAREVRTPEARGHFQECREHGWISGRRIPDAALRIGAAAEAMRQWFDREPATGALLVTWQLEHLERLSADQLAILGRLIRWWRPARSRVEHWLEEMAGLELASLLASERVVRLFRLTLLDGLLRDIDAGTVGPVAEAPLSVRFAYDAGLEQYLPEVLFLLGENRIECYVRHLARLSDSPRRQLLQQLRWLMRTRRDLELPNDPPMRRALLASRPGAPSELLANLDQAARQHYPLFLALAASQPDAPEQTLDALKGSMLALLDWIYLLVPPLTGAQVAILISLFGTWSGNSYRRPLSRVATLLAATPDLRKVWDRLEHHRRAWIEHLTWVDLSRVAFRSLVAELDAIPSSGRRPPRDLARLRRLLDSVLNP